ncbi:MAG: four helix bundle protein [Gammaproteobacteria bacterium]|uniref:four helix bundle protein n=1 Tax=Pseudomonas sp. 32.2.56 TaxID=2969303 RepID=UPI001D567766|nr:four helix bundle protein [Pseudomonas sp. 32.2.56]MBU1330908.1 four helix bundle protein [Gammaproteobacteria bacterium]MBU1492258.1 four helix bundle protein [Gammaproteobacteria bacterium]MBU2066829.1 four helix bundle protein [Gammaproteobacteria bacterium]MBU2137355.1 four helix bundle protein [Gammaproteobacteria bacterium]MBU2215084.1 four helix bundle protein [Gammaproteobacteria bacterium]
MAIAQHLPIYKQAGALAKLVADLVKNWRRDFKRTLGDKVLNECLDVSILIFRANTASGQQRVDFIQQTLERIQIVELMLRLAADLMLVTPEQHGTAIKITDDIGRQATGWKRNAAASPAV